MVLPVLLLAARPRRRALRHRSSKRSCALWIRTEAAVRTTMVMPRSHMRRASGRSANRKRRTGQRPSRCWRVRQVRVRAAGQGRGGPAGFLRCSRATNKNTITAAGQTSGAKAKLVRKQSASDDPGPARQGGAPGSYTTARSAGDARHDRRRRRGERRRTTASWAPERWSFTGLAGPSVAEPRGTRGRRSTTPRRCGIRTRCRSGGHRREPRRACVYGLASSPSLTLTCRTR
jgi:hypothetical protein